MSSASKAVASASQAISKATSSAPRRVSKRTLQTSRTSSLSNLISLYHLTPTFVPTANPSQLQQHVTNTLAPLSSATSKPRPRDLLDLVLAQHKLDQERIKLDTAATSPSSASLLGVRLRQTATSSDSFDFSSTAGGGGPDGAIYDHQSSFYSSHTAGSEPPLAKRVRRVVDKLHGTEAGGRAGVQVLKEQGEKAVQWKEGLRDARRQEKEREEREEREAEGFGQAFAA